MSYNYYISLKIAIITLLLFCLMPLSAQTEKFPYVVVTTEPETYEVNDSDFYRLAKQVVFPVSVYNISPSSKLYDELANQVMPYINEHDLQLRKVIMRGSASPDGPYTWNTTLSVERAKSVIRIVDRYAKFPSESVTVKTIPEDYIYLLQMMRDANDPDYSRVEAIVNKYFYTNQTRLKEKLKQLDDNKVWMRLLETYYPSLRTARFILVFSPAHMSKDMTVGDPENFMPEYLPMPEAAVQGLNYDFSKIDLWTLRVPRRELISIKSNLLLDFAYMPSGYDRFCPIPNVALEYYPLHGHFTYGASFDCPWWQDYDAHKYFQIRNYQIETRYYMRSGDIDQNPAGQGAAFRGLYFQAYAHAGLYSIMFSEHRGWEGEGYGGGLGLGYVLPISKDGHWRLEFGLQAGFFWTKYDPYQYECPVDPTENDHLYYYKWTLAADLFKRRQYRFTWFGPTRVGITLSYDLLYRANNKRWPSFRSWETAK